MHSKREHPDVIPTPAAVEQAADDHALDEALENAAREIADSLRRDELEQKQRTKTLSWIPISGIALIAIIVGFSLTRGSRDSPTQLKPDEPRGQKVLASDASLPQESRYTLRLPRGFEWQVNLVDIGNGIFHLTSDRNLNCQGLYRLHENRLEMYKPSDERLTEFVWEKVEGNSYVLIEEPSKSKTGASYLGATLERSSHD